MTTYKIAETVKCLLLAFHPDPSQYWLHEVHPPKIVKWLVKITSLVSHLAH